MLCKIICLFINMFINVLLCMKYLEEKENILHSWHHCFTCLCLDNLRKAKPLSWSEVHIIPLAGQHIKWANATCEDLSKHKVMAQVKERTLVMK